MKILYQIQMKETHLNSKDKYVRYWAAIHFSTRDKEPEKLFQNDEFKELSQRFPKHLEKHEKTYRLEELRKKSISILVNGLQEKNETLLALFIRYLGEAKEEAKNAVPSLIQLLHHNRRLIQHSAIEALGQIGKDAKDAIPALSTLLDSTEELEKHSLLIDVLSKIENE